MPFTVTATLVDSTEKPVANSSVRLMTISKSAKPTALAQGSTGEDGTVKAVRSRVLSYTYLPTVTLELRAPTGKWIALTSEPVTYTSSEVDFGTILVSDKPVQRVGAKDLFGQSPETRKLAPASGGGAADPRLSRELAQSRAGSVARKDRGARSSGSAGRG